ncbi:hypothetical protein FB451DRAFT_1175316 [Mycena latifolia]|nr:hypothetical protein FB451DRAFT_1175316 [Mycena latifolia]
MQLTALVALALAASGVPLPIIVPPPGVTLGAPVSVPDLSNVRIGHLPIVPPEGVVFTRDPTAANIGLAVSPLLGTFPDTPAAPVPSPTDVIPVPPIATNFVPVPVPSITDFVPLPVPSVTDFVPVRCPRSQNLSLSPSPRCPLSRQSSSGTSPHRIKKNIDLGRKVSGKSPTFFPLARHFGVPSCRRVGSPHWNYLTARGHLQPAREGYSRTAGNLNLMSQEARPPS